jgi:hypothetical protein
MDTIGALWAFVWSGYNLPFTIALIVCLFLSGLQFVSGGMEDGDSDSDTDTDSDSDGESDNEAEGEGDHDGDNPITALLDFMGLGRVPLTIFLLLFTMVFGLSGWLTTRFLFPDGATPAWLMIAGVRLGVLVWSGFITGRLARLMAQLIPSTTTSATQRDELVGRVARVASPRVDSKYGQVKVRDAAGTLLTLFAVAPPDELSIVRDQEVILVEFDPRRKVYTVVPLEKPLLEE